MRRPTANLEIVGVLDLMGGQVVRGVGGERSQYAPIVSSLVSSAQPLDVARAFRERFGIERLYLADLDAIAGNRPAFELFEQLSSEGFQLAIDIGIRTAEDGVALSALPAPSIVVGLETIAAPAELSRIIDKAGRDRVIFSLDMKSGLPLGWPGMRPVEIVAAAIEAGVGHILLLDLHRVGRGNGVGVEDLVRETRQWRPGLRLWAGGGVRDARDLDELEQLGVHGVLVASALHDGRLRRENGRWR